MVIRPNFEVSLELDGAVDHPCHGREERGGEERGRGRVHRRHELLHYGHIEDREETPQRENDVELIAVWVKDRVEDRVREARHDAEVLIVRRLGVGTGVPG